MRQRSLEWWLAVVRLIAVPLTIWLTAATPNYPSGYESAAWVLSALFGAISVVLYFAVQGTPSRALQLGVLVFDFAVTSAYALLFSFQSGTPTRQLLYLAIVIGAARFGLRGGVAVAIAAAPILAWAEERRAHFFDAAFRLETVAFQVVAGFLVALLVGWLYERVDEQRRTAELRADEAETLRDELGRRSDLLDAANRCARALNSSLDLDEAFSAFIRELRGLMPFDRTAIILAEEGAGRVIAAAGSHADDVMPPGTPLSLDDNLLTQIVARGQTVYRRDMTSPAYAEERWMLDLGLHSRVAAPLLLGARTVGMISLVRAEPDAFAEHEVELISLLGRLAASAVQNIRAYESERRTVDELRRLSALRADFVSLVSHELRSPMASVIGASRTLQSRWRELQPEQRAAFLALIADETTRLASLIDDVLDTSRIDAGTFTYRFSDVDLEVLVRDVVATAQVGQDEVPLVAHVAADLPKVRGDLERLRQVLGNLIDNAVKYSPAGQPVEVRAAQVNGGVHISVNDRGPGIGAEDQRLIFEKFGRVASGNSKPGTGLGLYIARSIAEAHGGKLTVTSAPGRGSTFTVALPVE
ncbi:MAG TPA: ATP-binding protein [Gaiellaceae bacterium]|nr:ATP-binding protein [Gaiellaceae bacterium]